MKLYNAKLIVIRGNSASGKSTVARMIRTQSTRKIAYVEQDVIRRNILKEKETDYGANIVLIAQIVEFALARDYDVILEGMLKFHRYGSMLEELKSKCPHNYFYYFDVSLEETLKRHQTKPIAKEMSDELLQELYKQRDLTNFRGEQIITEDQSADQATRHIIRTAGL